MVIFNNYSNKKSLLLEIELVTFIEFNIVDIFVISDSIPT